MTRARHKAGTRFRGFSLVELMVGLTIGLVIMATLAFLLVRSTATRAELDQSMQQIENGRYAIDLLRNEIRLAGYYGPSYSFGAVPAALPDPCAKDVASLSAALPLAVQGYSQPAANPISTCLVDANFTANNDILVVRRAQTVETTVASVVGSTTTIFLQSNGETYALDTGGSGSFTLNDKNGVAPVRVFAVDIYFVSPCDVPASGTTCDGASDSGTPIPTLKRLELAYTAAECTPAAAPCWKTVSLVQGVERFHVEYGVDNDGDGTPDTYVDNPGTTAAWANVVTMRAYVLARNTRPTTGYADAKTYTLGGQTITPSANPTVFPVAYKRHAFSETVRLINISGRRES